MFLSQVLRNHIQRNVQYQLIHIRYQNFLTPNYWYCHQPPKSHIGWALNSMMFYTLTQWGQCAFKSISKTSEEDERPVVSEGECKQDLNVA